MRKEDCRRQFMKARERLSNEQIAQLNQKIYEQITDFDWKHLSYFHAYLSISEKKEVDTSLLINWLWKQKKKVFTSVINWQLCTLETVVIQPETTIIKGAFSIPQPVHAAIADPKQMEVVFVPLLAFDLQGNRVGYGKGFYDRFLKQCRPNVLKVGLSFFDPIKKIADVDEFDVPLDVVFTPNQLFSF